ncbi:MAG: Mov34/MPN/PAD-1 family protein [Candidatus Acidiferrales bacterium]
MSGQKKAEALSLQFSTEVVRQIRRHARSNRKTEVCGVLIGSDEGGVTKVDACIAGINAAQGGAHVTFTQDTWEHIYKIKDRDHPDARIVGWYHSHPGFGVFLSDHDTFIHKNFFSSPTQVAWVYDPHSDEEGCFGWANGRLERLGQFEFVDDRGGQRADAIGKVESLKDEWDEDDDAEDDGAKKKPVRKIAHDDDNDDDELSKLTQVASNLFSHLAVLVIGGLLVWYLIPRIFVFPVPVDPQTGQPIRGFLDSTHDAVGFWLNGPDKGKPSELPLGPLAPAAAAPTKPLDPAGPNAQPGSDGAKKDDGRQR